MIVAKGKWVRLLKLDPPVELDGLILPNGVKLTRADWKVISISDSVDKGIRLGAMVLTKPVSVQEIETKNETQYFVHETNIHAIISKERIKK